MMATVAEQPATQQPANREQVITYVPLGEQESISLTLSRVKKFLCVPTRSGKMPSDEQVVKYMMLCKAQSLNPWVNDAYLVGYDSKDGPQFSLITAHQALLKRAEASPEFNGMESGVVVMRDNQVSERGGDLVLPNETLVGGWARVHRKDRQIPSYDALSLTTFNTGRSRWAVDPAGQIVKCAEASALRKAFPSTLAAMYCREEMERHRTEEVAPAVDTRSKTDRMAERLNVAVPPSMPVFSGTVAADQQATRPQTQQQQEPPAAIGYEPSEPAFATTDDRRELEPAVTQQRQEPHVEQRQQAPEIVTVDLLMRRIEEADSAAALKAIDASARKAAEQQQIESYEHDQIIVMLQEAKKRIGK